MWRVYVVELRKHCGLTRAEAPLRPVAPPYVGTLAELPAEASILRWYEARPPHASRSCHDKKDGAFVHYQLKLSWGTTNAATVDKLATLAVDTRDMGMSLRGEVSRMLNKFYALARKEEGATAVEYGLMVALIAVVIIGAVTLIGTNLDTLFNQVANAL